MIKAVALFVLICSLSIRADAQTSGDLVVLHYSEFMKSKAAVGSCLSEEGKMQIARNDRYAALLRANAKNPDAPTIDENATALAQLRMEDEALSEKRQECDPLFDQLAAATRALRRDCAAYAAPSGSETPAATADSLAIDICHPPAKSSAAAKPSNQ